MAFLLIFFSFKSLKRHLAGRLQIIRFVVVFHAGSSGWRPNSSLQVELPGSTSSTWREKPKPRHWRDLFSWCFSTKVSLFHCCNQGTESLRSTFFGISCLSLTPPPRCRSSTFNSTTGRWMSGHERVRGKHGARGATSTKVLKALNKRRELSIPYHPFGH